MNNFTKNHQKSQSIQDRKSLQEAWHEEYALAIESKNKLGYEHMSDDEFCQIEPDFAVLGQETGATLLHTQETIKELQVKKETLWAEEIVIEEFNAKHAVIHIDQTYILTEKMNIFGGKDFSLESRASFKNYYEDEIVQCTTGPRPKADIWLKSSNRRKYRGITFDPISIGPVKGHYNIWKGFAKTATQGDCTLFWHHVEKNICSNNTETYKYIRKWLAHVYQRPDEVHTALVLCGSQGVGKNSFVEPLGVLLGSHYVLLSSIGELVSNFNYHLKNAVLIHANEAFWGGHRREVGTLKAMITERTCLIEGKGKDRIMVKNFKHVILSSNEDWPVHLDPDDRRFMVLKVSEQHKEDHQYFAAIDKQLKNGGYEALLYDLLSEDLTSYNPRFLPKSSIAFDIKMRSADSAQRYIYYVLVEGHFLIGDGEKGMWQESIPKADVYDEYIKWCLKNGESKLPQNIFGRTLKKLIPSIKDYRSQSDDQRIRQYKLCSIETAREEFCKAYKEIMSIFDEEAL